MTKLIRIPESVKKEVEELKASILRGEVESISAMMRFAAMSEGPVFYQYLIEQGIETISKHKEYVGWKKKELK